jgi:glycosyltransferase involved in cell wall biosynthesis
VTLRIGIDARAAAEVPAGRGRYVRELLRAFAARADPHRYVLYTRRRWDEPLDERFTWRERELPESVWHLHAARTANRECDVFLATNSYVTPWFLRIPTALVVHDLIPFQQNTPANRRAARIERLTIRRALRRASVVICDSHSTRRDLVRRWSSAEPKASVAQLAADPKFSRPRDQRELDEVRRRLGLAGPFVLCAGTLEPRKNLVRVLDAYARLPAELRANNVLALVGPQGWELDGILERAHALGEQVKLLGHVSDNDLVALYALCEVFCYPSLYEGFGLPLLEAMSAGAPSITSDISSLPEVGGDAVRYVDPTNVESIASVLAELLASESQRHHLGELARERARDFSWARTANETLRELVSVVPGKRE